MTEAKQAPQKWHIKISITGPSKSKLEVNGIIGTEAKDAIIKVLDLDFEDAKLIAAAPELLEALRGMLSLDEDHQRGMDDDVSAEVRAARAAIAKVNGVEA